MLKQDPITFRIKYAKLSSNDCLEGFTPYRREGVYVVERHITLQVHPWHGGYYCQINVVDLAYSSAFSPGSYFLPVHEIVAYDRDNPDLVTIMHCLGSGDLRGQSALNAANSILNKLMFDTPMMEKLLPQVVANKKLLLSQLSHKDSK